MAATRKRVSPEDVYVNALSFRVAAMVLSRPDIATGVDKMLLFWPTVVCEAFSLELFIKCLHAIRRRIPKKKHDVEALYQGLSKADRKTIAKYFYEIVQAHPQHDLALKHGITFDVDSVLQRTRDTFIRVRYWHEKQPPSPDASGKVSNAGVGSLCDALNQFIDELRPQWRTMSLDIPVLLENLPPPT